MRMWLNESYNATGLGVGVDDPFQFQLPFRIAAYIAYNLVFLCGLLGNILVYYTIHFTHPRMKTVQNTFLGNLALGDLTILTLCVPVGYIEVLWQYWPFGPIPCHLLSPAKAIGVFVSSYTLVALAGDRYMAILYPLQPGLTNRQAKGVIILIWVAAFATAAPVAVYTRIDLHIQTGLPRCGEYGWESPGQEVIYNSVLLVLQYVFPVCVLIYTYTRILLVVYGKRMGHHNIPPPSKGKQKTVILSLSVVLCYTLAWLPYNALYMLNQHGPDWIVDSEAFPYLFLIAHFLAMAHTTFNPIIYAWINSKFRRAFSAVLLSKCPCLVNYIPPPPTTWHTSTTQTTLKSISDRRRESALISPNSPKITLLKKQIPQSPLSK